MIKVDKKIPLPPLNDRGTRRWPFDKMAVGDSFALKTDSDRIKCASAASYYGKRHGLKFAIRLLPDGSAYRCWRVS